MIAKGNACRFMTVFLSSWLFADFSRDVCNVSRLFSEQLMNLFFMFSGWLIERHLFLRQGVGRIYLKVCRARLNPAIGL